MARSTEKTDIYQQVTDLIISKLEQGVVPWQKPWSVAGKPKNLVSAKAYKGVNLFLLGNRGYDSPYWLTYKQAAERGGHVRRGEKGTRVIFWKMLNLKNEDDGIEIDETTEHKIPMARSYTVFNVEQCEGIEYPTPEVKTYPENERIEAAERIQLSMPKRPVVEFGGSSANYCLLTDKVHVPELKRFADSNAFYSVLFHELAHSTGHSSRLNRQMGDKFGNARYCKEELVAEMTSAYLCATAGIENTFDNSAAYIDNWIKALRGDKKLLVVAAAQAQKAANFILNVQE